MIHDCTGLNQKTEKGDGIWSFWFGLFLVKKINCLLYCWRITINANIICHRVIFALL